MRGVQTDPESGLFLRPVPTGRFRPCDGRQVSATHNGDKPVSIVAAIAQSESRAGPPPMVDLGCPQAFRSTIPGPSPWFVNEEDR